MLTNFVRSTYETITEYKIEFDNYDNCGFCFPCDENGNLLSNITDAAKSNYLWCLEHPEKYSRFNKVVKTERKIKINPRGTCDCGNEIELWDDYMGACECQRCGKWYNLFGQELVRPEMWED